MSLVLGTLFERPLHRLNWERPAGNADFRITNPFDGPDLINGGLHGAVDIGDKTGRPAPLLSPINGRCRGRVHWDTALGIEFDLGNGWNLQVWHLSETLPTDPKVGVGGWYRCRRLQRMAMTGNSGPAGLPYHSHVELRDPSGARVDPEPHLFGAPIEGAVDDMAIFTDTAGSPHEGDIELLAKAGIAAVGGTRKFSPEAPVTREQMASFLVRTLRLVEQRTGAKIFTR
jgi:hypothetical protein